MPKKKCILAHYRVVKSLKGLITENLIIEIVKYLDPLDFPTVRSTLLSCKVWNCAMRKWLSKGDFWIKVGNFGRKLSVTKKVFKKVNAYSAIFPRFSTYHHVHLNSPS